MIRRRFTIKDYAHMHESGVIADDERVELIEGDVHVISPIGRRHVLVVNLLAELLVPPLCGKAIVSIQNPAILSVDSEPHPDVSVFVYRTHRYLDVSPTVDETLLLIEVAESSVAFDRNTKIPLYAKSGIREAWLVDLPGAVLLRFTAPSPDGFAPPQEFRAGDTLICQIAGVEIRIDVAELLV